MKEQEMFALAVRIVGLLGLMYWFAKLGTGIHWVLSVWSLVWLLVSLWLLRGAPQLVRFAYPDSK